MDLSIIQLNTKHVSDGFVDEKLKSKWLEADPQVPIHNSRGSH